MSHSMRPLSITGLMDWMLTEYRTSESIFGIHKSLFHRPDDDAPYRSVVFGEELGTPIGPAAGPHTQLAQNIIAAWLCGGRFIELKTVQIMDELAIGRPCIDMEDEGYNTEWSQELRLERSVREYVKAWLLIGVLRRLLGLEDKRDGVIFNLSVGYNLEGLLMPRMQAFMNTMQDAGSELAFYREELRRRYPDFADVQVADKICRSATLSTMHGCPPDEIERIASYLLEERGFDLCVKLNPTLMGVDFVRGTLADLGYGVRIEDSVFEHDVKYDAALAIIKSLQAKAGQEGRFFGVKLSNTLAMSNNRGVLPGDEMYMSGRALYPITMNLWRKLNRSLAGNLNVSYSAGADAWNVPGILACGAFAVTLASDILKPGGYARLGQCVEQIGQEMARCRAGSLGEFAAQRDEALERAADAALSDRRYRKDYFPGPPKLNSPLALFDCIEAPCMSECAVCQDVPAYALQLAEGDCDGALRTIMRKNPLPGVTGHVCTHKCESRCTRAAYDEPVAIRALKRYAAAKGRVSVERAAQNDKSVAIVGAGPSGLSAAYTLAAAGCRVVVYEARERAGGMMAIAPSFRLPAGVLQADVDRVLAAGVELRTGVAAPNPPESLLAEGYDSLYLATGVPLDAPLGIKGEDSAGVWAALDLLERVAAGERPELGKRVLVVGGGNTAMDAARTACRLTGQPALLVYRRTAAEMPATKEEIALLLEEGNRVEELAAPHEVIVKEGRVVGLSCERTRLGSPDESGRRRPEPTGEFFTLEADAIIVAIGQRQSQANFAGSALTLTKAGTVKTLPSRRTNLPGVYAGGDLTAGPSIVIQACAEGQEAALAILTELGVMPPTPASLPLPVADELPLIKARRARLAQRNEEPRRPVAERGGFDLVEETLGDEAARAEAERCLQCSTVCGKCTEVCPNRANWNYVIAPLSATSVDLVIRDGRIVSAASEAIRFAQSTQVLHIADLCNECGNCATACLHEGRPYADKPRLYLNDPAFFQEDDGAFRIRENRIYRRRGGSTECLVREEWGYRYENEDVTLKLDRGYLPIAAKAKREFTAPASTRSAIEMSVILQGVTESLPWLVKDRPLFEC